MRYLIFILFGISACAPTVSVPTLPQNNGMVPARPQERPVMSASQCAQEVALVRSLFAQLQPISIQTSAGYCGLIGFDAFGALIATRAERGDAANCAILGQGRFEVVTASYHTHGAFLNDFFNELPSVTDVEGDEADGIDGYIATPGGAAVSRRQFRASDEPVVWVGLFAQ